MNKFSRRICRWGLSRRHTIARAIAVLVALVLLAAYVAAHQGFPSATGDVDLTVTMPTFSNDLVKVGTSVTTNFTATTGQYYPPVPAPDEGSLTESYAWSLTVKFSGTANGNYAITNSGLTTYTYSPDPIPSEASVPFTFTPHEAGYWQVSVSCAVTITDTKTDYTWYGSGNAGPEDLTSAIVTFSPDPIETGVDKNNEGAIFAKVTATVLPKVLASQVSANNYVELPGGTGRVENENSTTNDTAGTIVFDLYGTAGTAPNMPGGDVKLEAKDGSTVLGSALVIVEIPKAIGTPHPTFNGAVAPTNMALDASSVPAWWGPLNPGQVELVTGVGTSLSVPVIDQFGNPLNSVYNGQPVEENITGSYATINQDVESSYYKDPVGVDWVAAGTYLQTSQTAVNWPTAPTHPVATQQPTAQNFSVKIAGFTLDPSVVNRSVGYNAQTGVLTVTWP